MPNPGGGADRFDRIGRWTAIAGYSAQRDCFSGRRLSPNKHGPDQCAPVTSRALSLSERQPRVWGERNGLTLRWRSLTTARAFQFSHEVRTDPNHVAATLPIA